MKRLSRSESTLTEEGSPLRDSRQYTSVDLIIPEFQNTAGTSRGTVVRESSSSQWSVPGVCFGPVLFLMFINDRSDNINSSTRLIADDCILYRQILNDNEQHLLQEDLDRLATWEKTLGMESHPQKCSVLRIFKARDPRTFQYQLKGVTLEEEQSSKYLGVDIQSNLSWKNRISRITKKSNSMLGFLRSKVRQASEETKAKAYFTMVCSNLDYCCTIWNPHQRDQKIPD